MHKKTIILGFTLVFLSLIMSGCNEVLRDDGTIIYESHPTMISYRISYGYFINCSGPGTITIHYDCDTPEVQEGTADILTIFNENYEDSTVATFNDFKSWNLVDTNCLDYKFGLMANVVAESTLVSDLAGTNALDIQDINPNLVEQYCQSQGNGTITFIDPNDPDIISLAQKIKSDANTENALIIAKEIFSWLKQNTTYTVHNSGNEVQPACVTLNRCTGDCDDLSYLYMSILKSLKIPCRFIRGFLIEEAKAIPHAWVEVYVGGVFGDNGWIPVECAGTAAGSNKIEAEINQNFGVESAGHLRLFKDDGSNLSMITSLQGISFIVDTNQVVTTPRAFGIVEDYEILRSNELQVDKNQVRAYK